MKQENKKLFDKILLELNTYPFHKIVYVKNLLQNTIIEMYEDGKITEEKMDQYLLGNYTTVEEE